MESVTYKRRTLASAATALSLAVITLLTFATLPCNAQKHGNDAATAQQNLPQISISSENEETVDNLYLDDSSPLSSERLQRLLKLYPEEDFQLGDQGQMVSVTYQNCDALLMKRGTLANTVKFSFWHDKEMVTPCQFYEYTDKFDRNGNNITSVEPAGDKDVVEKELQHMRLTNRITRKRSDTRLFHVFVPSHIYLFADVSQNKMKQHENDTIYMCAELYDDIGAQILTSSSYVYWVRTPPEEFTGCMHADEDITEVETGRTKIDAGLYIVKFNRTRKCLQCGRIIHKDGLERTETADEENKEYTHEHVWQYINGDLDFNLLKREVSSNRCYIRQGYTFKVIRQCLICGEKKEEHMEDATILPNSDAPLNAECCPLAKYIEDVEEKPAVTVGDRMKMDKVVTTYFYCPDNGKKQMIGKRTETEWSEPCKHDFELVGTDDLGLGKISRYYHNAELIDHYRCRKCGMLKDVRRTKQCSHQYRPLKLCSKARPWIVNLKGVPLKMRLVSFEQDSTAVYVAETETTQQLWTAICPDNSHGWDSKSTYPATGVTAEEVEAFVSRLNTLASEQGLPVMFRLPKAKEWVATYIQTHNMNGWTSDYGSCIHPVAELPADEIGLFDMKGNAAELCSDTISIGEEEYKTIHTAVAGQSYEESATSMPPASYRWMDMTEGKANVGFRIFADPTDGDDTKLQDTQDLSFGATSKEVGNEWLVRLFYQCKTCGYVKYGSKYHTKIIGGGKPEHCE